MRKTIIRKPYVTDLRIGTELVWYTTKTMKYLCTYTLSGILNRDKLILGLDLLQSTTRNIVILDYRFYKPLERYRCLIDSYDNRINSDYKVDPKLRNREKYANTAS